MQEFTFRILDDGTYMAVSYDGDESHVVIPDTYHGAPVTILFDNLFSGHQEITSVSIPGTVTDIGGFVFDGCSGLKELDLPDSVTTLWQYAFARCGLTKIALPDGIQSIPPFAFKNCTELKEVKCGRGLKKIYAWAFGGCEQLEKLDHPPGKVEISPRAFEMEKGRTEQQDARP